MSAVRLRYIHYWLQYARTHRTDGALLEGEYEQLQRAWEMLGGDQEIEAEKAGREQLVIDYLLTMDGFLEKRGLLHDNIRWLGRGLEAAQALKQPVLLGRFGQDIGWCYRKTWAGRTKPWSFSTWPWAFVASTGRGSVKGLP